MTDRCNNTCSFYKVPEYEHAATESGKAGEPGPGPNHARGDATAKDDRGETVTGGGDTEQDSDDSKE